MLRVDGAAASLNAGCSPIVTLIRLLKGVTKKTPRCFGVASGARRGVVVGSMRLSPRSRMSL